LRKRNYTAFTATEAINQLTKQRQSSGDKQSYGVSEPTIWRALNSPFEASASMCNVNEDLKSAKPYAKVVPPPRLRPLAPSTSGNGEAMKRLTRIQGVRKKKSIALSRYIVSPFSVMIDS
jgi:hypothetical protein